MKSNRRLEIPELTGLRGVAAAAIIVGHLGGVVPMLNEMPIQSHFELLAYAGMSLFFILSGIVIGYNYQDTVTESPRQGIPKFFIARFARLYPLYIVAILGYFALNCSQALSGWGHRCHCCGGCGVCRAGV